MAPGLRDLLARVLNEYGQARQVPSGSSDLWKARQEMESIIQGLDVVKAHPQLRAKLSFGRGNWASVPWLAFLDARETDTTQDGVYPVYLFRQDMAGVHLTFNQGVTKTRNDIGLGKEFEAEMAKRKQVLRAYCADLSARGFRLDDDIDLGAEASLGKQYEVSTVAYKQYATATLPAESVLREDLATVLKTYEKYLAEKPKVSPPPAAAVSEASPQWRALQVGLDCQPFVLLAGPTGTGKTQTARRLRTADDVSFALVDVHGGWVDSAAAFGYLNPLTGRFIPGPVLLGLLDAIKGDRPILVLDEINVSPPHIYLAPLLAALERAFADEKAEPMVVYQDGAQAEEALRQAASEHPALRVERVGPFTRLVLDIPSTLRVLGTLNFDGSTEDLAPKLLSRSFVVWFEAPTVTKNLDLVARSSYATKPAKLGEALQALQSAGIPVSPRSVVRMRMVMERHKSVPGVEDLLLSGLVLPHVQSLTEDQVRTMQEQPLLDALPDGFCRARLMRMMEHARAEGFANLWLVA